MLLIQAGWFLAPEPVKKNVALTLLADRIVKILLMFVPSEPSSKVRATTLLVVLLLVTYVELAACGWPEKDSTVNRISNTAAAALIHLESTFLTPLVYC